MGLAYEDMLYVFQYDISKSSIEVLFLDKIAKYPGQMGFDETKLGAINPGGYVRKRWESELRALGGEWIDLWNTFKKENGASVGYIKNLNEDTRIHNDRLNRNIDVHYSLMLKATLPIGPAKVDLGLFTVRAGTFVIYLGNCKECSN